MIRSQCRRRMLAVAVEVRKCFHDGESLGGGLRTEKPKYCRGRARPWVFHVGDACQEGDDVL